MSLVIPVAGAQEPTCSASSSAPFSCLASTWPLAEAGASTGVVIFSSSVERSVKLTLHRMNGEEVTTQSQQGVEIDIPAYGHRTVFVRDIFPYVGGDFHGTMTAGARHRSAARERSAVGGDPGGIAVMPVALLP